MTFFGKMSSPLLKFAMKLENFFGTLVVDMNNKIGLACASVSHTCVREKSEAAKTAFENKKQFAEVIKKAMVPREEVFHYFKDFVPYKASELASLPSLSSKVSCMELVVWECHGKLDVPHHSVIVSIPMQLLKSVYVPQQFITNIPTTMSLFVSPLSRFIDVFKRVILLRASTIPSICSAMVLFKSLECHFTFSATFSRPSSIVIPTSLYMPSCTSINNWLCSLAWRARTSNLLLKSISVCRPHFKSIFQSQPPVNTTLSLYVSPLTRFVHIFPLSSFSPISPISLKLPQTNKSLGGLPALDCHPIYPLVSLPRMENQSVPCVLPPFLKLPSTPSPVIQEYSLTALSRMDEQGVVLDGADMKIEVREAQEEQKINKFGFVDSAFNSPSKDSKVFDIVPLKSCIKHTKSGKKRVSFSSFPKFLDDCANGALDDVVFAVESVIASLECSLDNGITALLKSVDHEQFEVTKYLLENGANVNTADRYWNTPLHIACIIGNIPIIRLLASQPGILKEELNVDEETPFDCFQYDKDDEDTEEEFNDKKRLIKSILE